MIKLFEGKSAEDALDAAPLIRFGEFEDTLPMTAGLNHFIGLVRENYDQCSEMDLQSVPWLDVDLGSLDGVFRDCDSDRNDMNGEQILAYLCHMAPWA